MSLLCSARTVAKERDRTGEEQQGCSVWAQAPLGQIN